MRLNSDSDFTIGRLSAETGANIETIRYYERIGLLAKPMRSSGGRRLYDQTASRRLGFIRRARELGFSIDDIRALLVVSGGDGQCADVHALTVRHLDDVRAKIRDLRRLERILCGACSLAEACRPRHLSEPVSVRRWLRTRLTPPSDDPPCDGF